jgi:YD repeat-containing protein
VTRWPTVVRSREATRRHPTSTDRASDRLYTTTYADSSSDKETLSYDADGNILTRQTRSGATITYTYDNLNRLSTKAAPSEPTVTYIYDLAGRTLRISDNSAAIPALAGGTSVSYGTNYGYDALNRLITATWNNAPTAMAPSASSVTFTHSYNAVNQRTRQAANDNSWWYYPPATASTVNYTANVLNQYSAVGSAAPTYDGNGNLTFDGTFTFAYDAENRLPSVKQGTTTVATYAYDAQSRRKLKTVGATAMVYVTDTADREVLEYDGATGQIQRWYAYGSGPDDVLNQMNVTTGKRATLIPDIQGSVLTTLDSATGAATKAGYLAYGENPSATNGTFRYTGRRLDSETAGSAAQPSGLYYYRTRMYLPDPHVFAHASAFSADRSCQV